MNEKYSVDEVERSSAEPRFDKRNQASNRKKVEKKLSKILFLRLGIIMKRYIVSLHVICLSTFIHALAPIRATSQRNINIKIDYSLSASSEPRREVSVPKMAIVFGRPGAGKTTIANEAIPLFPDYIGTVIGFDLDVYVPQWMKDNFAKGIYPTGEQRQEFAVGACDQIERQLDEQRPTACVVSFSFVNADLRNVFRSRFPNAIWALVSTTEEEAKQRIAQREGHFYKGTPTEGQEKDHEEASNSDLSEWDFAPVEFPHVILPGIDSIKVNAQRVADLLNQEIP